MSSFANINDNWKNFVEKEKNEVLEEGWKEKLAFGAAMLLGLTSAIKGSTTITTPDSMSPSIELSQDAGEDKAGVSFSGMPTSSETKWEPAPGASRYIHIPADTIQDDFKMPNSGETTTAGDFRKEMETYPIEQLEEFLYGKGAATLHPSGNKASTAMHPTMFKPMLAPTWSLAHEVYSNKALPALEALFDSAAELGVDPYESGSGGKEVADFEKRIKRLASRVSYEIPSEYR